MEMSKAGPTILLLSYTIVLLFVTGTIQQLQYAEGITNSTSTLCINGKCTTTMCIDNEPCRTIASNSTTILPEDSTKNVNNNTIISPAPLRSA